MHTNKFANTNRHVFFFLSGYIYDVTGDYNIAFYFAGSALALTAILVYLTCSLKDRIVDKLYDNLEKRQLEKGGSSTDHLDTIITSAAEKEDYDNPGFKMEESEEERMDIDVTNMDRESMTGNVSAPSHLEIHNSWERSSTLQDNDK